MEYGEQTRDKIAAQQQSYIDGLPQETRDDIEGYTGYEYYDVNQVLRNPSAPFRATAVESKEAAREKARTINAAIDGAPALTEDTTLFRGINTRHTYPTAKTWGEAKDVTFLGVDFSQNDSVVESQLESLVGTKFSDNGIISVSSSRDVADGFGGGRPLTMEIKVPAGKKALYVSGIGEREQELEFLLPSKTKFRILSVDAPNRIIRTEVIP
jgi:hypothetical protein